MPRNMSFMLTPKQIRDRTKTVTRRRGWLFVKPGDLINACVKCMGLKPGQKIERLALIRVIAVRRETLRDMIDLQPYGRDEVAREGFPGRSPEWFVRMFCRHMGGDLNQEVTRIKFEYVD